MKIPKKIRKKRKNRCVLTARQIQCLSMTAKGIPARAIALELGITEGMVRAHLDAARLRLDDASSTTQAVYLAAKIGLID